MAEPAGIDDAIREAAVLQAQGRVTESAAALRRILAEAPDQPDALHFLGLAEFRQGRVDEAVRLLSRAIAINGANPFYPENLGKILLSLGRLAEAEQALRRAVQLSPGRPDLHFQLGETLRPRRLNAEAEAAYRRALALDPNLPGAGNGLGIVLSEQGRSKEAEAAFRRALKVAGEAPDVLYNLGNVLRDQHRADDAVAAFRRAIAAKPDFAEARVHLAFALLLKGDYKPAWKEYEWRWRVPAFAGTRRKYPQPLWDGGRLKGRTLLLWAEQGFGDTLQFARYAGVAAGMGGKVILECQPALVRLMASADGVAKALSQGAKPPRFDVHAPLLSVPGLLGTTLKTVPRNVPYLFARPKAVAQWRKRLGGPGLKVGIAWRGTAERRGNPARACPLEAFRPLIDNPDIRVVSLQKDVPAEDRPLPEGVADISGRLRDFADTAAAIAALDLVVSIDTAVAHLAGGLGRPTLLALSSAGDWRWQMKRATSPWYPSVRIFRQARPNDWAGVLAKIAGEAARMAKAAGRPLKSKPARKRSRPTPKRRPRQRRDNA